ncbi:hypothetical protein BpHYR1_046240 [Brachionus plicatilis]|uniref:Uncharacterized protein n=1 Tax=Brachionus plicatilis TaxID=10195 RepID=A0A3M7PGB2_BRAPC|nr:hypothetical protein BpHYR1_046240 [Brachionus plicatilis]
MSRCFCFSSLLYKVFESKNRSFWCSCTLLATGEGDAELDEDEQDDTMRGDEFLARGAQLALMWHSAPKLSWYEDTEGDESLKALGTGALTSSDPLWLYNPLDWISDLILGDW